MGGLGKYLNGTGATSTQVPNVTDNSDPVIAGAARFLVKKYGSFQDIPITDQLLSVCLISFGVIMFLILILFL